MAKPWFGRKSDGFGGGPVSWQGWLAVAIGIGGGMACYRLLPHPINDWAAGGCALALILAYWLKYDPNTESY